ncbi:MAG: anaerobic c4-dicarboxylate antiporter, DcuC family [Firmicutes bacterium]|nr:anaerobic c4-dicarboxylate antiporter, DcuC family [Bacillota bacterium]
MLGVTVALIVLAIVGYLIIKDYKPQAVLLAGGFFMMAFSIIFNFGAILPAKQSTGFIWFDIYQYTENLLTSRTANLGILIMTCAGFARYMDKIGASDILVHYSIKPLSFFKSPYFVLSLGFIIGQFIHLAIPSASGLGLVLMVTMYPIYVGLGVSRGAATAVIATNSCLDLGPASANSVLASKTAGMGVVDYFVNYQLPVAIAVTIAIAITHYFVQQYFDKKAADTEEELLANAQTVATVKGSDKVLPPGYYAVLPLVPLTLILVFGYLKIGGIKLDIVPAMFIGFTAGMLLELIRYKSIKKVFSSMQNFFDGMGVSFATVITLIIAGEILAKGLMSLGAIDTVISWAVSVGLGKDITILIMCIVITGSAIVMGSGNAAFFSFAAFAPEVAKKMGFETINLILPMQICASLGRTMSPISGVVVAIAGIAQISPFEVVKRTAIPMVISFIINLVVTFMLFKG